MSNNNELSNLELDALRDPAVQEALAEFMSQPIAESESEPQPEVCGHGTAVEDPCMLCDLHGAVETLSHIHSFMRSENGPGYRDVVEAQCESVSDLVHMASAMSYVASLLTELAFQANSIVIHVCEHEDEEEEGEPES